MTGAAQQNVLELLEADGGSRRPSAADVGIGLTSIDFGSGPVDVALKEVEGDEPTLDGIHPYAAFFNQLAWLARAAGLMLPSVKLTIKYAAGAPVIDTIESFNTTLSTTDFTLADLGTGQLSITWESWKIPPLIGDPMTTVNGTGAGLALTAASSAIPRKPTGADALPAAGSSRIYVDLFVGAVATDLRFTIWL